MPSVIEFTPEKADSLFDELPECGDDIEYNGNKYIITGVNVVNERKLTLKVKRKKEPKRFDDPSDYSIEWNKLPERFLKHGGKQGEDFESTLNNIEGK